MTPPHCCRVRLLCNTSMSHPQLFLALLLELGRGPGFVPQLGRGQCRPHCQSLPPSIGREDFGLGSGRQRAGAALLFADRFLPCPLAIGPHPLPPLSLRPVSSIPGTIILLSLCPFIPVPFALHPCPSSAHPSTLSHSPPNPGPVILHLRPLTLCSCPICSSSSSSSSSTSGPLTLHQCPPCPPSLSPLPSILILLSLTAPSMPREKAPVANWRLRDCVPRVTPLFLCCGHLPVWEHWGTKSSGFGGLSVTGVLGAGQWECWGAWRFAGGHWAEGTALLLSLSAIPNLALCLSFPSL